MILDDIVAAKRKRLAALKEQMTTSQMMERIEADAKVSFGRFAAALQMPGLSVIAEVKKASPSKGVIAQDFDPGRIAAQYERGGADAVSVLTERDFFLGSTFHLAQVHEAVSIPALRKDFIIDEIQICEARLFGAEAVLLIAAILSDKQLTQFREFAQSLGMDALVESHDEDEMKRAISSGAQLIGINNRDLKTFDVSLATTERLIKMIPADKIVVSESGILSAEDARLVSQMGADAVLVGESLMRADDPAALLRKIKSAGAGES